MPLNDVMLSIVVLGVIMLNEFEFCYTEGIILSVGMLSVIMLNVIMLSITF